MDKYVWSSYYLLQTAIAIAALEFIVFPFGVLGVGVSNFISIATFIKLQRIIGGVFLALVGISIVSMCRASYLTSLASDLASLHR
jgi:hypothetical protein